VPLVGVELVRVPDLAAFSACPTLTASVRARVQCIGCRADCIDHGVPSSVCSDSCVLARRARRLGGHACLLAGDPRALSVLSQALPFLSNCFTRLAIMITNLTRFLGESPELFRLARGSLRGRAVVIAVTSVRWRPGST
jgi:hypothetical protein